MRFYNPVSSNRVTLLRDFSIISFSTFILATGSLVWFSYQQEIRNLAISAEANNTALARLLGHIVLKNYKDYGSLLSSTQQLSNEALASDPRIQKLQSDVLTNFAGLSIVKIKIFDLEGRTVFSTEISEIGVDKSQSSGFRSAKSGIVVSQLNHHDVFTALRTNLRERDLFSSYIPIRLNGSEGDVVGVFELYTDVTPLLQQIKESWRNIVVANLLILTTLYVILFLFVRWAENLIKYQYQQLRDSEERYRHQASELECTLAELQKTQSQMLQSAKMSSLGQLVAGVAHEINNPVTFIHGNLSHVQNYAQDLMKLVKLYQHHYPEPNREIQSTIEHIDLTFIQNDLPKTLASMEIGSDRIREIVLALRIFSRLNEAAIKAVDIHEGLDSTLMILQHRLKPCSARPEIQVLKDYDALPQVECYPGLLNQVFMNILTNAIDALDDLAATQTYQECLDHPGQIRLQTSLVNDQWVEIAIADNGAGIRLDVQRRIFDPFFTTKPVGKGTGMGLSISYQIVAERHRGTLECFSILGQGTEFRIQIPLKQLTRDSVA